MGDDTIYDISLSGTSTNIPLEDTLITNDPYEYVVTSEVNTHYQIKNYRSLFLVS